MNGGTTMATLPIANALASNWWLLLFRGILAVLFGLMAFAWPALTLVTLILLYGAYALVDGLTALWVGVSSRAWGLVLFGLLGVGVGIYAFVLPGITAIVLLYLIAAWALVRGIFEIVTAIQLRREINNEWVLILSGIISILFAIVLVVNPEAGALAMVMVIGAFALIFGVMLIVLAFRIRGLPRRLERLAQT
jgi:uncharacterized membrane protein HdeD (DUF308 family)